MRPVIGLDIAKRVFQLHTVDPSSGEIHRAKLKRAELLEYFGTLSPAIVAMEACGSSNHWACRFTAMGHEVRLIATKFVRPFVKRRSLNLAVNRRRDASFGLNV
jgi:Transposase and inactivated derivatives